MAPPWLKPWADAWVGSGGGCQAQGARGDPASVQIGKRGPILLNLQGQVGGQRGKAAQLRKVRSRPVQPLCTEETSSIQFFSLSQNARKT